MRHVWTLIAAAVIAPLAWLLLAFGQDRSVRGLPGGRAASELTASGFVLTALCLAAAGVLLGLLASVRVSPLGAVVTGMAYSASYLIVLASPDHVVAALPDRLSIAGHGVDPTIPLRTGTALMVGALLLLGVVSAGRWRRWPERPDVTPEQIGERPGQYVVDVDTSAADAQWYAAEDRPLGADGLGLRPATSRDGWDGWDEVEPRSSDRPSHPVPSWQGDNDRDLYYAGAYERGDLHRGAYHRGTDYARQSGWSADREAFRD